MGSRELSRIFALVALATASASCSSREGTATPSLTSVDKPNAVGSQSTAEAVRVQAYLDSRYRAADVRHSFQSVFGETIDCIDFFATPGVKALAAQGTRLTQLPTPPPRPPPPPGHPTDQGRLSEFEFNGQPDETGSPRVCPAGSVPEIRITARSSCCACGRARPLYAARPGRKASGRRPLTPRLLRET